MNSPSLGMILLAVILLGSLANLAHAKALKTIELTPWMKDRFEQNCAIRDEYDLYSLEHGIDQRLDKHVVKDKFIEEPAYISRKYQLKNVTYRGVPVVFIEYSYGNIAKQINQTLYFDLSTTKAKNDFSKIKFKLKQTAKMSGLDVEKSGKFTSVHCYWEDPFYRG